MTLDFERGDRAAPVGHALIYFRADGAILATYVSVPPIQFDLGKYVPGFMAQALQGMDISDAAVAAPMPPIPEQVDSTAFLQALAARRQDDLIFAGSTTHADPMRLAAETAEAAREYGELYQQSIRDLAVGEPASTPAETPRFAQLSQEELLQELTALVGRVRVTLPGPADLEVERELRQIAEQLPPKYRVQELIEAAHVPGERGQRLAELHIERCYKLYNEEYLDLERIDREIDAIKG
ncbi:MAG TPA: hypothetical protein VKX16_08200 [Chloroflexota bacterium]|nr:hypothetical protein [Chloroflexota bacterium]